MVYNTKHRGLTPTSARVTSPAGRKISLPRRATPPASAFPAVVGSERASLGAPVSFWASSALGRKAENAILVPGQLWTGQGVAKERALGEKDQC